MLKLHNYICTIHNYNICIYFQAALGSLALDRAKMSTPLIDDNIRNGQMTLTIAVLSILLTAPLGAIGISLLGKILLTKNEARPHNNDVNEA